MRKRTLFYENNFIHQPGVPSEYVGVFKKIIINVDDEPRYLGDMRRQEPICAVKSILKLECTLIVLFVTCHN